MHHRLIFTFMDKFLYFTICLNGQRIILLKIKIGKIRLYIPIEFGGLPGLSTLSLLIPCKPPPFPPFPAALLLCLRFLATPQVLPNYTFDMFILLSLVIILSLVFRWKCPCISVLHFLFSLQERAVSWVFQEMQSLVC